MALADKIRAARESRVPAGDHIFVIRRPTDLEMMEFRANPNVIMLLRFVIGWEKVREIDILEGGDPHPCPFSADVLAEWFADRLDLLAALTQGIVDAYNAHKKGQELAEKN